MTDRSAFLSSLAEALDRCAPQWAVMRNYEGLPDSLGNSDLDILVGSTDMADVERKLVDRTISGAEDVAVIGVARSHQFQKVCFLIDDATQSWGACVDLNCGLYFRGAQLAATNFSGIVSTAEELPTIQSGVDAVLGVLKEILNNDLVSMQYLTNARVMERRNWGCIESLLEPMGRNAISLLRQCVVHCPPGRAPWYGRALRRSIALYSLKCRPTQYLMGYLSFQWSKVARYMRPPGSIIAVLGVDGSGKSSVIAQLMPTLLEATHGNCELHHLRPSLLPALGSVFSKNRVSDRGSFEDPHGAPPSGVVGSLLRLIWLLTDYLVGYWFAVRKRVAQAPSIVLFDRYAYDICIDPRRFRINLPTWILRSAMIFVPKPDFVLCLHADSSVVRARKQELSEAEITRQTALLREFASASANAALIATDGSLEESRTACIAALVDFFRRKRATNG